MRSGRELEWVALPNSDFMSDFPGIVTITATGEEVWRSDAEPVGAQRVEEVARSGRRRRFVTTCAQE